MEDSNMKELLEQFLSLCQEYQKDYDRIIIKNGSNEFRLFIPGDLEKATSIIYECEVDERRTTSFTEDIDELIEWAIDTVGEEKIQKIEDDSKIEKKKIKTEPVSFYGE